MSALFAPKEELIIAIQLQQPTEFEDPKSGQKFFGQIGDWKVYDEQGNIFLINYFQFAHRYKPYNDEAFELYAKKQEVYSKRGKYFKQLRKEIKSGDQ